MLTMKIWTKIHITDKNKDIDTISNSLTNYLYGYGPILDIARKYKIDNKIIENYINAKQKIVEFRYSNEKKLQYQQQKIKTETEKEVLKLIGNKVLDFERKLLNSNGDYTNSRYINETRTYINGIFDFLCSLSNREENKYKMLQLKYKQLSKQAKKEKAIEKRNSSSWNWEDEI